MPWLANLVLLPFRRYGGRVLWALSSKRSIVYGMQIAVDDAAHSPDLLISRIHAGFQLLDTTYPRWLNRTRHDVNRVLIHNLPSLRGLAWPDTTTISIASHFLLQPSTSTLQIASVIVHEATHAGLARRGIPYDSSTRIRHETACLRAEMRFLGTQALTDEVVTLRTDLARQLTDADAIWRRDAHITRVRHIVAQLDVSPRVQSILTRLGEWFHST